MEFVEKGLSNKVDSLSKIVFKNTFWAVGIMTTVMIFLARM